MESSSNNNDKFSDIERIDEEASDWLVYKDRGFTPSEQDEFFQWLAKDPRHGERFGRITRSWGDFNLVAEWRPEHSLEPNPDLLATSRPHWWMRWNGIALGAAAAVAVAFFTLFSLIGDSGDEITNQVRIQSNGYEYVVLEDGSEIDMNEGAEVSVEYSKNTRLVRLLSGEAHFTVSKNPKRPFVVTAGAAEVRAIGTAFNVKIGVDRLEVLVTEGKVRLDSAASAAPGIGMSLFDTERHDLVSGQRSTLGASDRNPQVEEVGEAEMRSLLKWKPELLDFESTPLAEVVEAFNRRNEVKLVLAKEELGEIPIVASFRSNNVDGFARLLELTGEVEVDRSQEGVITFSKR